MLEIELGNSYSARLYDVTDSGGTPIDTAAAFITLYNRDGTEVAGQVWPTLMLSLGNGVYEATLEDDLSLQCGRPYRVQVDATAPDGSALSITDYVVAVHRGAV